MVKCILLCIKGLYLCSKMIGISLLLLFIAIIIVPMYFDVHNIFDVFNLFIMMVCIIGVCDISKLLILFIEPNINKSTEKVSTMMESLPTYFKMSSKEAKSLGLYDIGHDFMINCNLSDKHKPWQFILYDKRSKAGKIVIDEEGFISDYPGLVIENWWMKEWESPRSPESPIINFGFTWGEWTGELLQIIYTIQVDGRYWEDDGYGAEDDQEIDVYSFIDRKGNFLEPFKIYRIGAKSCYESKS